MLDGGANARSLPRHCAVFFDWAGTVPQYPHPAQWCHKGVEYCVACAAERKSAQRPIAPTSRSPLLPRRLMLRSGSFFRSLARVGRIDQVG